MCQGSKMSVCEPRMLEAHDNVALTSEPTVPWKRQQVSRCWGIRTYKKRLTF